jgi:6-phosphogluconolactonase
MGGTSTRQVQVFEDLPALSEAAAGEIIAIARESIAKHGRFSIALSGGNTPKQTYQLVATRHRGDTDWSRWDVLFGDERFVPSDDTRSNYKMARETLLAAPIPREHVYAVPTDTPTVGDAADAYGRILQNVLIGDTAEPSPIDLVLLGVGPDGHTASLFPGSPALEERTRWARAIEAPTTVLPSVPRVSLTLPVLNAARNVIFLVAGADKRPVLAEIFHATDKGRRYPAAMVANAGRTLWMVERSAMPASEPNT